MTRVPIPKTDEASAELVSAAHEQNAAIDALIEALTFEHPIPYRTAITLSNRMVTATAHYVRTFDAEAK